MDMSDDDFDISLFIELPENYPDVLPNITIEGLNENFDEERIQKVHSVSMFVTLFIAFRNLKKKPIIILEW